MGPEQWPSPSNLDYYRHFMDGANHKGGNSCSYYDALNSVGNRDCFKYLQVPEIWKKKE